MVQQCYAWVKDAKLPSKEIELKLIETLRTITKGKIYVEVERARLTHRLSQMQEADGDIAAAAKTMQDLQGMCTLYTLAQVHNGCSRLAVIRIWN